MVDHFLAKANNNEVGRLIGFSTLTLSFQKVIIETELKMMIKSLPVTLLALATSLSPIHHVSSQTTYEPISLLCTEEGICEGDTITISTDAHRINVGACARKCADSVTDPLLECTYVIGSTQGCYCCPGGFAEQDGVEGNRGCTVKWREVPTPPPGELVCNDDLFYVSQSATKRLWHQDPRF